MTFTIPGSLDGLPRRRHYCDVCASTRWVSGSYVFNRGTVCTCGAGPYDELTLHDGACDSVPCPFCQLLNGCAGE